MIKKNNLVYLVMIKACEDKIPPFPLMLLSSVLKKNGFEVKVEHCDEKDIERITNQIIMDKPLLVGFSVLTGLPTLYSVRMSKLIKSKIGSKLDIPIVWGGVHPSLLGEQCLKEEYIDYIVQGEGEIPIIRLAECISKDEEPMKIPGVGYKKDEKITVNKNADFISDLDNYGLDFECVDLNRYVYSAETKIKGKKVKMRILGYYGSRGCPHNCAFCYNLMYNRRRWRAYSAAKVIRDVKYLKKRYDVQCIHFWDDNFFVDKGRAIEILKAIDCFSEIEIRIDYFSDELAKKLKGLKVRYMLIGGESGSDRILRLINKGFNKEKIFECARLLNKYGLDAQYSFILGIPTETRDEAYETIDTMRKIGEIHKGATFTVGGYLPYPGNDLYKKAIKKGFKAPKKTEDWSKIDRWRNTVDLPWISKKFCLNTRHLFALSTSKNPFIRFWVKFRIKNKIIGMNLDLKMIIIAYSVIDRIKSRIKRLSDLINIRKERT